MLVFRWGPWSVAAVALAVGVVAGLLLPGPGGGGAPGGPVLLLLAAAALPPAARLALLGLHLFRGGPVRGRTAAPGAPAVPPFRADPPSSLAVLGLLWAGVALGASARERALARCAGSLETGEAVRASGRIAGWGVSRDGRGRAVTRIRLEGARLTAARGTCHAGPLLVLVDGAVEPAARGGAAGRTGSSPAGLTVAGTWWRYPGAAGRPRSPGRHGLLRAEEPPEDLAPARPVEVEPAPWGRIAGRLRRAASTRLASRLGGDVASLGSALLLADRDGLPSGLRERFADAGLAHLLAVSGLHVGVIGALVLGLVGLVLRDRRRYPASAVLTLAYVVWIGAPPSAARAGFLYAGWAFCRGRGRPTSVLELLAAAAAAAILVDPLVLLDVGFQLSFAGFFGLLVGIRLSTALRSEGPIHGVEPARGPAAVAGAAAGAFLATAPLVAAHFQRLAPVAVASGLAAAPLVGGAVPTLAATAALPEPLAVPAARAATGLLRALVWLAGRFAELPGAGRPVPPPGPAGWTAVALTTAAAVRLAAAGRWSRAVVPVSAALAVLLAWPAVAGRALGEEGRICALDVGQGDAVAVRTAAGHWILVDGGPGPPARDAGLESVVPHLRRWGVRRIEVLVLTHPHLDHVGGLGSVMDAFPVGEIWDAATAAASTAYLELLDRAAERNVPWRVVAAGDRFRLDGTSGTVLAPPRAAAWRDPNEASVVLRLSLPSGLTALLTGDAGPREERWMLERWPEEVLRARILKVAHHGSRSSTGSRWLASVDPGVALISAGRGNRYGHPHREVLLRLEARGRVEVRRTDREGTVCVGPDGAPPG